MAKTIQKYKYNKYNKTNKQTQVILHKIFYINQGLINCSLILISTVYIYI